MNAPLSSVYTNEASPDQKDYLFSQQLEGANKDVLRIIEQQRAYGNAHPPTAIYRVATAGSQPRNGRRIQRATSPLDSHRVTAMNIRGAQKIMPFPKDLH